LIRRVLSKVVVELVVVIDEWCPYSSRADSAREAREDSELKGVAIETEMGCWVMTKRQGSLLLLLLLSALLVRFRQRGNERRMSVGWRRMKRTAKRMRK
jgi:hypothetical protein